MEFILILILVTCCFSFIVYECKKTPWCDLELISQAEQGAIAAIYVGLMTFSLVLDNFNLAGILMLLALLLFIVFKSKKIISLKMFLISLITNMVIIFVIVEHTFFMNIKPFIISYFYILVYILLNCYIDKKTKA